MEAQARGAETVTVTQAMNAAKRGLEQIRLTVVGEVSELNDKPGYKAVYFTVRDDKSAMPCLMWRNQYRVCGMQLRAGMLVELTGYFSCYTAKGRMQFSVNRMAPAGEGTLRLQVAQLARKLEAEGLMDASRKRRTPALPKRIAVVTSPRGKAVHDVIRTLRRRYPMGELYVCGVPVEGEGAPQHIIEGLRVACEADPEPDVILLVRGGGSYEDLMPFNDESLARAVAACPIPVVTGIGHEPDNSICDMVADLRCSTPTAAAEAVAPSVAELQEKVGNAASALRAAYEGRVLAARHRLGRLSSRPLWSDGHYLTGGPAQELDQLGDRLARAIPDALVGQKVALRDLSGRLARALPGELASRRQGVEALGGRLARALPVELSSSRHELEKASGRLAPAERALLERCFSELSLAAGKLDALSPLKTLSRGYSITYAADGKTVLSSVEGVGEGDALRVQVRDGTMACAVTSVERQE